MHSHGGGHRRGFSRYPALLTVGIYLCLAGTATLLIGCYQAGADRPAQAQADSFTVQLENVNDEDVFRLVLGPIDIPAGGHGAHHGHQAVLPEPRTVRFPRSVHMTGFRYDIFDGSGKKLPSEILHHMNVIKPAYRELFLPISQRMLALGNETGAQSLPWFLFGHPIEKGTEVVVSAMLHNPIGRPLEDVTVVVTLDYVEADRLWPLWEVYPFQLDVQFPAGEKAFDLPPGRSEFHYEGSPVMEGRIVAIGSHLHDFAEDIRFEDVTTGELIWQGFPVKQKDGTVSGVTIGKLYKELGKKIYPDHVYRVTVRYLNPTADTLREGGMGVVGGAFIPAESGSWPRADTSFALYKLDRMHYLRKVSGTYEELLADVGVDSVGSSRPSEAARNTEQPPHAQPEHHRH